MMVVNEASLPTSMCFPMFSQLFPWFFPTFLHISSPFLRGTAPRFYRHRPPQTAPAVPVRCARPRWARHTAAACCGCRPPPRHRLKGSVSPFHLENMASFRGSRAAPWEVTNESCFSAMKLKHGETKVASFKHTDATREVNWVNILPFVAGEKVVKHPKRYKGS